MEGLALAVLLGVSGGLLYTKKLSKDKRRAREGFAEIMNPDVAKAFNPLHNEYVQTGASRFNPIQNLMDPNNNVLLPPDFSQQDVNNVQRNLRNALGPALAVPNDPSYQLKRDPKKNILLNAGGEGTALAAIKTCEAIKSIDCNAFDNPEFAISCGVCFEDGKTSSGNPTVGGLYITEDDRASAEAVAKRMNSRTVNYQPSTGKCASGMFVTTKEQCIALKKKIDCAKGQSFDNADCSQCFQDSSFRYTAPDLLKTSPSLVLTGSGRLSIVKVGSNDVNISATLSDKPQEFELPNFSEGDVLQISVTPATGSIAGYLIGVTPSGDFRMDIIRLIQTDMITGAKPRMAGVKSVGEDSYTLIRPGRGQQSMKLALLNTFTFLETSEQEAIDCGSAPYITKESSATFLESSPCFKKGQRPGNFSLECLQKTFVEAGCTEQGDAYPSTQSKAQALMTGPDGRLLTVGQIAGTIYEKSLTAYTGMREDGSKLSVKDWDAVSRFCTGKSITSPCDFDNKDSGPLSAECLSYLWKNTGATENVPGNVGSTYSSSNKQASLNATNNDRFCTPRGTMAPIDDNGKINDVAVAAARAKGGVKAVQEFYNQIHLKANDNTQSDDARQSAVQQCYGVDFQKLEAQTNNEKMNIAGTIIPQTLSDSITGPRASQSRDIDVKENWIYTFTINPNGTNSTWTSIFHVSHNKSDWDGFGSRIPGVWFFPNSTQVRVHLTLAGDQGWFLDSTVAIPLNKETNVTMSLLGNTFTMKFTGGVDSVVSRTIGSRPYVGRATLMTPDPFWPSFKGTITNFSYGTGDNAYPSVLDFRPGRTKSSVQDGGTNYTNPSDWSRYSCPAVVLGNLGMGPWGRNWEGLGSFPDDGTARWIWTNAGAATNETSWNTFPFLYRYQNNGAPISARLYVWADNIAQIIFNDVVIADTYSSGRIVDFEIPRGESCVQINASNQGGPAGLIVMCKDVKTNRTLFVSNEEWLTDSSVCGRRR